MDKNLEMPTLPAGLVWVVERSTMTDPRYTMRVSLCREETGFWGFVRRTPISFDLCSSTSNGVSTTAQILWRQYYEANRLTGVYR